MTDKKIDEHEIEEQIHNKAEDGDFKEAIQEDDDEGVTGDFKVTAEELAIIRADLATEFPDDFTYLSDAYILSVASKPYSKDPTKRRPLEYSQEKLTHLMQWRAENGAADLEDLVKLANGSPYAPEAVEDPEKLTKAKAIVTALNYGSMYWHGYTKDGQPILWVRTNRKPWYPDVDAEVNALMLMADAGVRAMPEGVTDFVAICESSYPPPPNPTFLINVLKALVRGYPDRLKNLISAPVSSIVQFVMNLLLPLMPGRLASKLILLSTETIQDKLKQVLLNGEADIPNFFGGPADHDVYFPEEGKCPNRGEGTLKFDYFNMVDRMEQFKKEYEAAAKK